jgi:UDP-2,3-diacylglucosamine pyrophosphatase LpxH
MDRRSIDTLIISDLHLGSELSRASDAVRMLKSYSFRRLILLGDIFCDLDFSRLKKDHWSLLSYIRKLSNPKRGVEVVWVEGNHDQGLSTVMSHLVGVRVYQQYVWNFHGRRCLAIHGHQFDRFVVNNALLSKLGASIYLILQRLDSRGKHFSRWLDRLNSAWLRLTPKVAEGALRHAKAQHADLVFCGHTHGAFQMQSDGIGYFNAGCWTNGQPTYITLGPKGVHIHEHEIGTDHSDPGEERSPAAAQAFDFNRAAGLPFAPEHPGLRC